jgi:hypothetical protein
MILQDQSLIGKRCKRIFPVIYADEKQQQIKGQKLIFKLHCNLLLIIR